MIGTQPIPWWLETLNSANFVLIVASPGARLASAGKLLKRAPDRHYDNYYAAALAIVLQVLSCTPLTLFSGVSLKGYPQSLRPRAA